MSAIDWEPPAGPALRRGQVHVWLLDLKDHWDRIPILEKFLPDDESARAGQYHFEKDRRRYIISRGNLRRILADYLACRPGDIRFRYNRYGKPLLDRPVEGRHIAFNISHSGSMVVCAFALNTPVGIDVEKIRDMASWGGIVERFFSEKEKAMLAAIPPHLKSSYFFHFWACKEAYIKAHGKGLALSLDEFTVSSMPGRPASLVECRRDNASDWSLEKAIIKSEYIMAVAVKQNPSKYLFFDGCF